LRLIGKAEVGDKVLIVKGFGWYKHEVGSSFVVIDGKSYGFYGDNSDYVYVEHESNSDDEICCVTHTDYHVLEPLKKPTLDELLAKCTPENRHEEAFVDTTQASPEVIDLLANLARRVTSLESQLRDTQNNVEKQARSSQTHATASPSTLTGSQPSRIRSKC
jgi:hypothetical protein